MNRYKLLVRAWLGGGVARVCKAHSARQISVLSTHKKWGKAGMKGQSIASWKRQAPAHSQATRDDRKKYAISYAISYTISHTAYRIRYRIYMRYRTYVYDIVYDIVYDSHRVIHSACLAAPAKRRRFKVSAPLRLDS
jgi:hypothetical protein